MRYNDDNYLTEVINYLELLQQYVDEGTSDEVEKLIKYLNKTN